MTKKCPICNKTLISKRKTDVRTFCSYKCKNISQIGKKQSVESNIKRSESLSGQKNHRWSGGIYHHSRGYILHLKKGHPFADKYGYVMAHRLIMEERIGRYLLKGEVVHHINGIKDDNRFENLKLMTLPEHTRLHHIGVPLSEETKLKISKAHLQRRSTKSY